MIKTRNARFMLLSATASIALAAPFENKAGWKMDGDKLALDGDGNPIYVNSAGQESSVKGDTIANLNNEAKTHRTAKEAVEAQLAKFKGADGKLLDPDIALKAVDTVGKLDAKKLIDAGEVDKVRAEIEGQYKTQLTEKDQGIAERDKKIDNMLIDGVFRGNPFVTERVAIPGDFFEAQMRNNFKVEDGKVVAYDKSGNRLMSKKSIGEYADPTEALELLVETHPQRDSILKAPAAGGAGNGGGGGSRGGGNTMKRSAFDALSPAEQAGYAPKLASREITIVD